MGTLALTPGQRASLRSFEKIVSQSTEIVEAAGKACDVKRNDGEGTLERPAGMGDRDWNIVRDALLPSKLCPVYLHEHYRMVETAHRIAKGAGGENIPIIQFIQNNFQAPKYDVIDVTPLESKKDR